MLLPVWLCIITVIFPAELTYPESIRVYKSYGAITLTLSPKAAPVNATTKNVAKAILAADMRFCAPTSLNREDCVIKFYP